MKLLIITQTVNKNDQILGFFHRWIEEFSKNVKSVKVICLEKGEFSLPDNVEVMSLGKEAGAGKIKRLLNFYKYIWVYRKEYDAVFVHMNQIYIILGGLFWRIMKKKVSLWYAHGKVSLSLRIAERIVNLVFTSTPGGFNIDTTKKKIVGQGIDTELFKPNLTFKKNSNKIITVGRVSEIKKIAEIIDIITEMKDYSLDIVGAPIRNQDFDYAKKLYIDIHKNNLADRVIFSGPLKQEELPKKYNESHIFLNLSRTGSLDKTILEAMSCGLQVVTTNIAAKNLEGIKFICSFNLIRDAKLISEEIKNVSRLGLGEQAREFVVKNHGIEILIPKIVNLIKNNYENVK